MDRCRGQPVFSNGYLDALGYLRFEMGNPHLGVNVPKDRFMWPREGNDHFGEGSDAEGSVHRAGGRESVRDRVQNQSAP